MTFPLEQYVVYDHPRDDPDHIVVRRWEIGPGMITAKESTPVETLDEARAYIQSEAPGTVMLYRSPEDDPAIMEVWL